VLGLQSAAGTPPAIVEKLQAAVAKILRESEIAERMKTLGIHMAEDGTAAYVKLMEDELDRYSKVVDEFHLQIKQ
jgi:tripartite-type tricarboxylate transporter receptor subunit TctC